MSILEVVHSAALRYELQAPSSAVEIRGLWRQEYVLRLTSTSSVLALQFMMVQTGGSGCCYFDGVLDGGMDAGLLGANALHVRGAKALEIACLDAVLSCAPQAPREEIALRGSVSEKAQARSGIVVREVAAVLNARGAPRSGSRYRIVNVGVVGEFIAGLTGLPSTTVRATDFSPTVVGSVVHGVHVDSGMRTLDEVAAADVAVVTGMTLWNGTLDEIIAACQREGTSLVMFTETGASFAPIYCAEGVDVVISEPYPFYLSGPTDALVRIFVAQDSPK